MPSSRARPGLIGGDDTAHRWARAHQACLQAGSRRAACCAFWLAYGLMAAGEVTHGSGWFGRANGLVDQLGADYAERATCCCRQPSLAARKTPAAALERVVTACEIATRCGDPTLARWPTWGSRRPARRARFACRRTSEGQCMVHGGEVMQLHEESAAAPRKLSVRANRSAAPATPRSAPPLPAPARSVST